jgi:hypothetical protein
MTFCVVLSMLAVTNMYKVILRRGFLRVLRFSPVSYLSTSAPYSFSFIYHGCSFLRVLDHTQLDTHTPGRTPLNE